ILHRERGGPIHRYVYEHDALGARVVEQHNEGGLSYYFRYHDTENRVSVRDSLDREDHYQFEGEGGLKRLICHTQADGSQITYTYGRHGRKIAETDPLGRKTRYQYDGPGRLTELHTPDGAQQQWSYDTETGLLISYTDVAERQTYYRYDTYGRLIESQTPDGITRYGYPDPQQQPLIAEQPIEITDPTGKSRHLAYNTAGQLIAYTDCSGHTQRYQHDGWGDLIQITNPAGHSTHYERNEQGQLISLTQADGSKTDYHYNVKGQLIGLTHPNGQSAQLTRDTQGRITQQQQGGETLQFDYDSAGRITRLVNENGAAMAFRYDVMDRLIEEHAFDGRQTRYHYDQAGQLIRREQHSQGEQRISHYRYDKGGQLIKHQIEDSNSQVLHTQCFGYDAAGRLRFAEDHKPVSALPHETNEQTRTSRVQYHYNDAGYLTQETQLLDREGQKIHRHHLVHRYTALGDRSHTYFEDLGKLQHSYYGPGHTHGLLLDEQELIAFERDAQHREIERRLLNGLNEQRGLDLLGRMIVQQTQGDSALSRHYHYNSLG
ncbi:MAG: hypothetical protein MI754_12640, partial [Chromatiales bacterium]|nr:hypothetical protein [Chromatiales bacterium]